jgi:dTDP-4-dehydrorhamnose reductase
MKVIIIGAKGMLGQELARTFVDYQPLLWDRQEIDITDEYSVSNKISGEKPDVVINAAAFNDVDAAEEKEPLAKRINGSGPGYLAKSLSASGGILVHYSTDYVFRGDKKEGYLEEDSPEPQSAYARSKYLGEQEVQKCTGKFYIIRLSRLFGQPAASETAKKSFVQLMLDLAKTKKELNVVNEELDCPTFAPDLALRTREIIEQKKPYGLYHVTNSGACTWYDFAKEIFTLKNIDVKLNPVPTDFFPRPAVRPKYSVLLNTKLTAMRSWQEALKEFLVHNL